MRKEKQMIEEAERIWKLGLIKEEEVNKMKDLMKVKYEMERDKVINLRDYDSDNDEEISRNAFKELYPNSQLDFAKVLDHPYMV